MKISIVSKDNKECKLIEKKILRLCKKYKFTIDANPDVVFSIGGDGTLLRSIHQFINKLDDIIFVGIDVSTLGFTYDFTKDELEEIFIELSNGKIKTAEYKMLEGKIDDSVIYAMNEIRIENPFHTLICDVKINGEELETFHGNGLLVCSSFGSTAYNKSANGALIDPSLDLLELTEIATIQNNVYRSIGSSLILSNDSVIEITGNFINSVVGYDYLSNTISGFEKLTLKASNKKVKIAIKKDHSFIKSIRRSFVK